jgi:hypothetical protein
LLFRSSEFAARGIRQEFLSENSADEAEDRHPGIEHDAHMDFKPGRALGFIRRRCVAQGLDMSGDNSQLREKASLSEIRTPSSSIETHRLVANGLASCGFQQ